jgi:hypothetical protein
MVHTDSGRPSGLPEALKRWGALLLGLFVIWLFVFVLAPRVAEHDAVRPLVQFVEESGIDAGALYYTETKETGDAENYLRNSFLYPPNKK